MIIGQNAKINFSIDKWGVLTGGPVTLDRFFQGVDTEQT